MYYLIGDIHGHATELKQLLKKHILAMQQLTMHGKA